MERLDMSPAILIASLGKSGRLMGPSHVTDVLLDYPVLSSKLFPDASSLMVWSLRHTISARLYQESWLFECVYNADRIELLLVACADDDFSPAALS